MNAILPHAAPSATRMLVVRPGRTERPWLELTDTHVAELACLLSPGDALVLNDAATLPASVHGKTTRGEPIELRLLALREDGRGRAVLFGAGDFRTRTEHRPEPPPLCAGDVLAFGALRATLLGRSPRFARLWDVQLGADGAGWLAALYRHGCPVQYAHHEAPLPLYAFQTAYAARPWAVEMPSAGRPLGWSELLGLRRRGVRVLALTHAAGLSSTGDAALDAALPLAERFEIPEATVRGIAEAREQGKRVVAVGTTVVRALESSALAHGGEVREGESETELVIDASFERRVVTDLLTGVHTPDESHFRLLRAFADEATLARAHAHSKRAGYRRHELGDVWFLRAGSPVRAAG